MKTTKLIFAILSAFAGTAAYIWLGLVEPIKVLIDMFHRETSVLWGILAIVGYEILSVIAAFIAYLLTIYFFELIER